MALRDTEIRPAFVFDIDGVIVKGKTPLPRATKTIAFLQRNKVPFIFLTNGGGLTEEAHAERLSSRLGLPIDADQIVQSHTPFRGLVDQFADEPILILGGTGDQVRDVAHAYGFGKVITTADVFVEDPTIHPFPEMTGETLMKHGRHWKDIGLSAPIKETSIKAILVWTSPRDWCLDLQIVMDLLLSENGFIGTRSVKKPTAPSENGDLKPNQPTLFFCNPDVTWATQADQPRVAQGAFKAALEGIWQRETGGTAGPLPCVTCGKPTELTYTYGEDVLQRWAERDPTDEFEIRTIYMVGDNPASDIQGANSFVSQRGYI